LELRIAVPRIFDQYNAVAGLGDFGEERIDKLVLPVEVPPPREFGGLKFWMLRTSGHFWLSRTANPSCWSGSPEPTRKGTPVWKIVSTSLGGALFKAAILSTILSVGAEAAQHSEKNPDPGNPPWHVPEHQPGRRARLSADR